MGARKPVVDFSTTNVGPLSAETQVRNLTVKGIKRGSRVLLTAIAQIQTDGGGTNPILRIRRGTGVAGTLVGEAQTFNQAVSTLLSYSFAVVDDDPGEDQDYSFTVQSGANFTVVQSMFKAEEVG